MGLNIVEINVFYSTFTKVFLFWSRFYVFSVFFVFLNVFTSMEYSRQYIPDARSIWVDCRGLL